MKTYTIVAFACLCCPAADALNAADKAADSPGVLRFESVSIKDDPRYIGGEIASVLVPAGWKVEGGPLWDLNRTVMPCDFHLTFHNPAGVERLVAYPQSWFFWNGGQILPRGSMYMGQRVETPLSDAVQAINMLVIPRFRPDLRSARVVRTEPLPKLAQAVVAAAGQPPQGVFVSANGAKVRFEYDLNGVTVEEDIYAVLGRVEVPGAFINWNVEQVCSIRGPRGKLDALETTYRVIEKSTMPNIQWYNQYAQVCQALQNIQQNAIDQAKVRSRIISQTQKEISATIQASYENRQAAMDRIAQSRSQATRGVTRYNTGEGSSVELPTGYNHAWKGTNGQYILSSDPAFDPNQNSQTTWTEVHPAN